LDDDADNEVQGLGWWEVPREQRWSSSSAAAIAADPAELRLEPWQEKQLLLAAASSKKKMQVRRAVCWHVHTWHGVGECASSCAWGLDSQQQARVVPAC
jgi:hypothetical protein